jgi:hypothetical protein
MKCSKCKKEMHLVITTRIYREDGQLVPIVVSFYQCPNGHNLDSELRKKYFCKRCGRLSYGKDLCGMCQNDGIPGLKGIRRRKSV